MYKKRFSEDIETNFELIKTKPCEDKDFNNVDGSNEESNFYKVTESTEILLKAHGHKLKCIDGEEFSI